MEEEDDDDKIEGEVHLVELATTIIWRLNVSWRSSHKILIFEGAGAGFVACMAKFLEICWLNDRGSVHVHKVSS